MRFKSWEYSAYQQIGDACWGPVYPGLDLTQPHSKWVLTPTKATRRGNSTAIWYFTSRQPRQPSTDDCIGTADVDARGANAAEHMLRKSRVARLQARKAAYSNPNEADKRAAFAESQISGVARPRCTLGEAKVAQYNKSWLRRKRTSQTIHNLHNTMAAKTTVFFTGATGQNV